MRQWRACLFLLLSCPAEVLLLLASVQRLCVILVPPFLASPTGSYWQTTHPLTDPIDPIDIASHRFARELSDPTRKGLAKSVKISYLSRKRGLRVEVESWWKTL